MKLNSNKESAKSFYRMAYEGQSKESGRALCAEQNLHSHNPRCSQWNCGFIDYFDQMHRNIQTSLSNLSEVLQRMIFGSGYYHQKMAWNDQYADHGFFSFDENGKKSSSIRDSIQQIPKNSAIRTTMYLRAEG